MSWNGAEIGMLALAFLAAHAVRAQEPVLAKIPFAFTAGTMALPAGEYRIEKLAVGSAVLLIQGTDNRAATFVMSNPTEANRPQTKYAVNRLAGKDRDCKIALGLWHLSCRLIHGPKSKH